jgi:2-methylcitrate dehydratase PrpD
MRSAPGFAALINGTAMHVDNFDDTGPQASATRNGGIHATAAVLPAALALAEARGADGAALSAAVHVGLEIAGKLNHAVGARHYGDGFHVTGTIGVFGAAAACAHLMDFDAETTSHTLALAASRSAGLRANFGFMAEQAHTGQAAEAGLLSALLAGEGMTGAPAILEAPVGWFQAAGGGVEPDAIHTRLGAPWVFDDPGMSIKPWPNGALTHPAMTLLSELIAAHGIAAGDVAGITVRTNARIKATLIHNRPSDTMQARFSMPFCLAALLVAGNAGLAEFTDETVARADIRAMMARIDYGAFDSPGADFSNVTTLMTLSLTDGTTHEARADYARGSNRAPMSWNDITEKFNGCLAAVDWPEKKAAAAIEAVAKLESLDDLSALIAPLTA